MMGDADRLWRVVWKLVFNAIKFTPPDGRVDVAFEHRGGRFLLVVSDTGEGFPPDVALRLFGCFNQEDRSSTRRHGGLGLGLAIVRRLVELHGGSVRAESAGRGRGAVFTVDLPACAALPPHVGVGCQRPEAMTRNGGVLAGVRVLVVTDDVEARAVMAEVLEHRGAMVIPAVSAEEALTLMADSTPDVVIGDWWAPGVSTPIFLQRMALDGCGAPPSIAVVGSADVECALQALSVGFRSYIAKPIHPAHLVAAIARFARGQPARPAHPSR
jgi:CheY-like chemotaxis protein